MNFYLYLLYLHFPLRLLLLDKVPFWISHGCDHLLEFVAVHIIWRPDTGLLLDWLSSIFDHSPVPIPEAEIYFHCLQLDVVFYWTIH